MNNRLYNIIFPIWLMLFNPLIGIPMLFVNYFIDRSIYYLILRNNEFYVNNKKSFNTCVNLAFIMGITVDFLGFIFLVLVKGLEYSNYKEWIGLEVIFTIIGCSLLIGFLNYHLSLTLKIPKNIAFKIGVCMGIITTPWLFLIPPYYNNFK
ncbi:hypothetical protein Dtox_0469 [Desulfofarcimen acetoxidans DSM 771]|uniref:Uncharacterized protein n=1 Tax=Desulfofarcimen acetoxidans (strain ATCC 49208 / DSM 771 / KCTC 5769 / VKM B-1644 / 5575) TaxID=485916 RepID=C8W546_DESAS|nr:hypothetical protein Dtox_0469 [Desulfofarcimen acetoxidans DSM 771]